MIDITWDLETEHLNLGLSRPWQCSYVVSDNKKIIRHEDMYIDIHDLNISNEAARVTKFDREKYDKLKIPAKQAVNKIKKDFFSADRLIAHNGLGYDIYILANLFDYVGEKLDFSEILYKMRDTLCISRAQHFNSPPPKDINEFMCWQYRHLHKFDKSFKGTLTACCERNGIEVDKSRTHDSLYDTEIGYKLFKQLEYTLELP